MPAPIVSPDTKISTKADLNLPPKGTPLNDWIDDQVNDLIRKPSFDLVVKHNEDALRGAIAEIARGAALQVIADKATLVRNLVNMANGHAAREGAWPLHTAPRDATLVRLLVEHNTDFWYPLKDENVAWTVGHNTFELNGEEAWQFVGWDWTQDEYVDCCEPVNGKVIGWLPLGFRAFEDGRGD